jgi:hypothetical protein
MTTTYRRTNTDSDLGGGTSFNKAILLPENDTTGSQVVTVANNTTVVARAFTAAGVPSAEGVTGNYTVEQETLVGNNNIALSVMLHRVNSSGTVQTSSAQSAEQTATAGTKTFSYTSLSLGTWAAGDRLRIDFYYRNTAHGSQDFTVTHGGASNEVVAPWDTVLEPNQGQFNLVDSTTVSWSGEAPSNGEFNLLDSTTLSWVGEAPTTGDQYGVGSSVIVREVSILPSNGEFNLVDSTTLQWLGSTTSNGDQYGVGSSVIVRNLLGSSEGHFEIKDYVTVGWNGETPIVSETYGLGSSVIVRGIFIGDFTSLLTEEELVLLQEEESPIYLEQFLPYTANGQFNLVDSTTLQWVGEAPEVTVSEGQFDLVDSTTLQWLGSTTSNGEFNLVDSTTVSWSGEAPEVGVSNGHFDLVDTAIVSWQGSSLPLGEFNLVDSATVEWIGSATGGGQFDLVDTTTVTVTGNRESTGTFAASSIDLVAWVGATTPAGSFAIYDNVVVAWFGNSQEIYFEVVRGLELALEYSNLVLEVKPSGNVALDEITPNNVSLEQAYAGVGVDLTYADLSIEDKFSEVVITDE